MCGEVEGCSLLLIGHTCAVDFVGYKLHVGARVVLGRDQNRVRTLFACLQLAQTGNASEPNCSSAASFKSVADL